MNNFLSNTTGEENTSLGNLIFFNTARVLRSRTYTTPALQAANITARSSSIYTKTDVDISDSSFTLPTKQHSSAEGWAMYKFLSWHPKINLFSWHTIVENTGPSVSNFQISWPFWGERHIKCLPTVGKMIPFEVKTGVPKIGTADVYCHFTDPFSSCKQ